MGRPAIKIAGGGGGGGGARFQKPIFNPTIQLVFANLYTIFKVSILNGCEDIFDEKSGEKEKRTNTGKKNRIMSFFNPTLQLVVVNLYTKFEVSIINGCGDTFEEKSGEKEKGTNTRENK